MRGQHMSENVPQGKDLKGKLCGVSDSSLFKAKQYAEQGYGVVITNYDTFNLDYDVFSDEGFTNYEFAYPVSDKAIEQMKSGV